METRDVIDEHFILTVHDLINGTDPKHIEAIIQFYEELEEYEICAGMNQALQIFKQSYNGSR